MIQRNTDASHLPADIFALHDPIIDIADQAALPAGEREDGLTAAVLVLAAFTLYFVTSLLTRSLEGKASR